MSQLTKEQQNDLYRRKVALGEVQGEMTGYASIDKPWLKYYDEAVLHMDIPSGSMYDYLHDCNKDYGSDIAIEYFGAKLTFNKLEEYIQKCRKSLIALGLKKGDVIGLFMLTTPETIALFYAANSIGIICAFLVVNTTAEEIKEKIKQTGCKFVFSTDLVYSHLLESVDGTQVTKIIKVPLGYSMPKVAKLIAMFRTPKFIRNNTIIDSISWAEFIQIGKKYVNEIEYSGDNLAVAVYMFTGGTTGISKGCEMSNSAGNAIAFGYINATPIFSINRGESFLSIIPPWLSYGLYCAIHMPLCAGVKVIISPDPAPKVAAKLLLNKKINHFTGGPMHLEGVVKSPKAQNMNFSFLKTAAYGGDSFTDEWEQNIASFFSNRRSDNCVIMGYGMSELAGTFCTASHQVKNMIPFAKNNVKIVTPDTTDELLYGEEGEILAYSPSMMNGYFGYEKETKDVFTIIDGKRWLHTGDLGVVNPDGFVKITGRLKRIYCSKDEEGVIGRVYPMKIEAKISELGFVDKVAVVGIRKMEDAYDSVAFVVLRDGIDTEEAERVLIDLCNRELPYISRPKAYKFVLNFPQTRAGKTDYKALEGMVEQISNEL